MCAKGAARLREIAGHLPLRQRELHGQIRVGRPRLGRKVVALEQLPVQLTAARQVIVAQRTNGAIEQGPHELAAEEIIGLGHDGRLNQDLVFGAREIDAEALGPAAALVT